MTTVLEPHDSILQTLELNGSDLRCRFSGHIHGTSSTQHLGWYQNVEMHLSGVAIDGSLPNLDEEKWLSDGSFQVGEETLYLLPVPFRHEGDVQLHLTMMDSGEKFRITANSINVQFSGEPGKSEDLSWM